MTKINNFVLKHHIKMISFIIAIILWFYARSEYFPTEIWTFSTRIEIHNLSALTENGFILANQSELEGKKVEIRIEARADELNYLESVEDEIKAIIDFKPIDFSNPKDIEGEKEISIQYVLPSGETEKGVKYSFSQNMIKSKSDLTAKVILDKRVEKDFAVMPDMVGITAAEGYTVDLEGYIIDPETVTISGAKTIIDKVDHVGLSISASSQATKDIIYKGEVNVYDASGEQITEGIEFIETNEAVINIPVYKVKTFEIKPPEYESQLPEGYVITDVSYYPQEVTLYGPEEELDNFEMPELEKFIITSTQRIQPKPVDLRSYLIGKKLNLRSNQSEVTVTFTIEQIIEREITIAKSQIEVKKPENSTLNINTENLTLTIKGIESIINAVEPTSIVGNIDVSEAEIGTQDVPVSFSLPGDISIVEEQVNVNITFEKPDEDTETTSSDPLSTQ